jgi:5-methylcytosine-specific restriction endonuclease McrA
MPIIKTTATISWEFKDVGSVHHHMERASHLLEQILDTSPTGIDYSNFRVHMEVGELKNQPEVVQIKEYTPKYVFSILDKGRKEGKNRIEVKVGKDVYTVKVNSDRYTLFRKNLDCVSCGLRGTKMILECRQGEAIAHFNLYGVEDGQLILMTKDHIHPKSLGGLDRLDNYHTYCQLCNGLKASYPLEPDDVRTLREMNRNPEHLPVKVLRQKIAETRILLVSALTGQ